MTQVTKDVLLKGISPPLDKQLAEQMLDEFASIEKRFVLRDWEPATLDGGQFSEAVARLIYAIDSGSTNRTKGLNSCLNYVEDEKNANVHQHSPRKPLLHISRVLRATYKVRSARGAVHLDPDYTANHLDSKFVLECARWVLSEVLRLFWNADRAVIASAVRGIVEYDVPAIAEFDGRAYVQRVDLRPEEELLVILHWAGEEGLSRTELGKSAQCSAPSVTTNIKKLASAKCRQVVLLKNGNYRLTDSGVRRVLDELGGKLIL